MRVLLVKPGEQPAIREIDRSLSTMQELVGGTVQAIYPFDDPVALICNGEGKLLHLPANRVLRDENGRIYDIIYGSFFLCGTPPDCDRFTDLTEEQVKKYKELFGTPQLIFSVGGQLVVLPML